MYTELFNPIYATRDGLPVIIVGMYETRALVVDDDGRFSWTDISQMIADVRFVDGAWHDVSPGSLDEEG